MKAFFSILIGCVHSSFALLRSDLATIDLTQKSLTLKTLLISNFGDHEKNAFIELSADFVNSEFRPIELVGDGSFAQLIAFFLRTGSHSRLHQIAMR